jgi:DNA-binding response OmpR family regulator
MTLEQKRPPAILVVDDVEETRRGIERLLTTDGYLVITAAEEEEAILKARLQVPNLILISLEFDAVRLVALARRLRDRSGLPEEVPVVIFEVATLDEGSELDAGYGVYMTRPDNFDQLRSLLIQLLQRPSRSG